MVNNVSSIMMSSAAAHTTAHREVRRDKETERQRKTERKRFCPMFLYQHCARVLRERHTTYNNTLTHSHHTHTHTLSFFIR